MDSPVRVPDIPPLPHAYPFLLIDRVLTLTPGAWVAALKNISRNDPLVAANGVFPAMLLVEIIAQAAGVVAASLRPTASQIALAAVDRFRCRPPVIAGDQLLIVARLIRAFGNSVKLRATITVEGRVRAAGDVVLYCA